ncbi:MAG: FHA domain-containing protein [Alphaproteobacteria bacterium]
MAKLRIGRSDTNDIVLDDTSISRKHAELEDLGGGAWRLTDIGSSAGTFVKDAGQWTQISSADIEIDTEVRFGEAEFNLADIISVDPATIRPNTASGLGQRAEQGAMEISREMKQPGRPKAPPSGSGGGSSSGLTKNTKILLFGGGAVLALLIVIVVVVALVDGGGGSIGGGTSVTGAKAELARMFTASCQNRGKQSTAQCECMGKAIADSLSEEEASRIVTARRDGKKPPREVAIKLLGGALSAARKCASSG